MNNNNNNNNNNLNALIARPPELAPSSYWFSFYDDDYPLGDRVFYSRLFSGRCRGNNKNGNRCRKRCVIGIEFCHTHLPEYMHLQIRPSEFGLGLFAFNPNLNPNGNDIVFRNNNKICNYEGEYLTNQEMEARYGLETAPYGMYINQTHRTDSALHRGIGAMINHGNTVQQRNVKFSPDPARNRVILKATKNIRQNEQLYVSYGRDYDFHDDHRTRKYKTLY